VRDVPKWIEAVNTELKGRKFKITWLGDPK